MNSLTQTVDLGEAGSSSVQHIQVAVVTPNALFNGYIVCKPHQRLLDVLNSRSNMDHKLSHEFLEIRDVDIYEPSSRQPARHLDIGYARRSNIVVVGERTCKELCRVEKPHPMRSKKPIKVEIELLQSSLQGEIYAETWQDLPGALHRNETFLPVTGVRLEQPLADGTDRFDFVAVNRDHVVFVGAEHDLTSEATGD